MYIAVGTPEGGRSCSAHVATAFEASGHHRRLHAEHPLAPDLASAAAAVQGHRVHAGGPGLLHGAQRLCRGRSLRRIELRALDLFLHEAELRCPPHDRLAGLLGRLPSLFLGGAFPDGVPLRLQRRLRGPLGPCHLGRGLGRWRRVGDLRFLQHLHLPPRARALHRIAHSLQLLLAVRRRRRRRRGRGVFLLALLTFLLAVLFLALCHGDAQASLLRL
mmetsp:Transcript_47701/g.153518  ORF Transcript_47701/g.153518 Transcript_47701/m.153518 type:complete len:218 (+) Transcript_47701:2-655(+)